MILAKLMGLFIIILIKWYFIFYLLLSCHQPSKNQANIHRKAMAFCFNEQINAIHVLSNLKFLCHYSYLSTSLLQWREKNKNKNKHLSSFPSCFNTNWLLCNSSLNHSLQHHVI